jgi:hypothetical protein
VPWMRARPYTQGYGVAVWHLPGSVELEFDSQTQTQPGPTSVHPVGLDIFPKGWASELLTVYSYADLPMQGGWVVDSGPLDFPYVSVKKKLWKFGAH